MQKIKTMLRRIKNMSFERMFMHIRGIHEESGKSKILIFLDMLWCAARYGVGYLDYHVFGFVYVKGKKRKTYMTMSQNELLTSSVNNKDYIDVFIDKTKFNETFNDFIHRDFIDLRNTDIDALIAFAKGKESIFAKVVDECGGHGIEKIKINDNTDFASIYQKSIEQKQYLIEDTLIQHETMRKLSPTSINTLRMTTVLKDGKPHLMYTLVRMGDGESAVDNVSSGGMYSYVDDTGTITAPAFRDKDGRTYDVHPKTQQPIVGFTIPLFEKAKEMVLKAALVVPQVRYVGWDIAICQDGPALVEGNIVPGYDMVQNYHFKQGGILPKFQSVFGVGFTDLN